MHVSPIVGIFLAVLCLSVPACDRREEPVYQTGKIAVISPQSKSVNLTERYSCQIRSQRHVQVRALEKGYLEATPVKEGEVVKAGDLLFKLAPIALSGNTPSPTALRFGNIKAPFDGVVGRLEHQQGSLILEGETLTTLSDNSVMWAYFNVPEASYLEFMAEANQHQDELQIELLLANGNTFPHVGKLGAIESDFNTDTGNISFRADFPNPEGLLRYGQTGTILIHEVLHKAIVIPERATWEVLQKRFVYVIDKDNVAREREIVVLNDSDDLFVVKHGLDLNDKIVAEGNRRVRDGEKVEYEID